MICITKPGSCPPPPDAKPIAKPATRGCQWLAWTMGVINPGNQWNEAHDIERLPLGERRIHGSLMLHKTLRDNPPLSPATKGNTSRNSQIMLQPNAPLPTAEAYAFDPSNDSVLAKLSSLPLDEWRRQQAALQSRSVDDWLAERERLARHRARRAHLTPAKERRQRRLERYCGCLSWCLPCWATGEDADTEAAEAGEGRFRAHGPSACAVIACGWIVLWSLFAVSMAWSFGHVLGGVLAFVPVFVGAPLCCCCYTCWAGDYKASLQGKHEGKGNEGMVLTVLCVWCGASLVVAAGIVVSVTLEDPLPAGMFNVTLQGG